MQECTKLITILGKTASGKSELAVFLAHYIKKHKLSGYQGAEIISADSRQVYKYLDIGTNKVSGNRKLLSGSTAKYYIYKHIIHHCIDFVHPRKTYTTAEYQVCAKKAIAEIINRNNIPILVGGTGLYIQAVTDGLVLPEVSPNKKLRALLEKKSTRQLFAVLQKLDPERANNIDSKNPRRLIRAIEILKATRKPIPALNFHTEFETLFIGIKKGDAELKHALAVRSKKQIPGLLREIKLLLDMRISKKRIRELGFEYSLALAYLEARLPSQLKRFVSNTFGFGSPTSDEICRKSDFRMLVDNLIRENWQYTKRQMTWFKKNKRIQWVSTQKQALVQIKKFLLKSDFNIDS